MVDVAVHVFGTFRLSLRNKVFISFDLILDVLWVFFFNIYDK